MSKYTVWNKPQVILLSILLLAGLLRLTLLGSKSLWFDEAFSVSLAHHTPARIWQPNVVRPETHPPLYYHGLHYWINWFGDSETLVRLPSALISLLNVALIYVLGRRLFNKRSGIVAAALLALSPLNLWYAQEARMYVFMTAILLLAAILLTWDSWWAVPPLTATLTIGLYLDYTLLPVWALISAIWFVAWWQRGHPTRPFQFWLISSMAAWLLFLPWLANFYDVLATFSTVHLFMRLNEMVGLPVLTPGQYLVVMLTGAVILVPVLAALLALQRRESSRKWVSTAVLVLFAAATLLFPWPRFYGIKRILVQVWPLMILWVAWIVDQLGPQRRRITWGLLVISLAASLANLTAVPKDDWRGAFAYVNNNAVGADAAAIDPLHNAVVATYYDLSLQLEGVQTGLMEPRSVGDLWFFAERFPGQAIPSSQTEKLLNKNRELIEAIAFYRLEVRRYRAKEQ